MLFILCVCSLYIKGKKLFKGNAFIELNYCIKFCFLTQGALYA